jgi:flagellar hook-basal body complex protein FliE
MDIMSPLQARGHIVELNRTNPQHLVGSRAPQRQKTDSNFAAMLADGLNTVNNHQQKYSQLLIRSVTEPDSVDSHDVTIAAAKANMSLNIAKSIVDEVIRAYTDITNLR